MDSLERGEWTRWKEFRNKYPEFFNALQQDMPMQDLGRLEKEYSLPLARQAELCKIRACLMRMEATGNKIYKTVLGLGTAIMFILLAGLGMLCL